MDNGQLDKSIKLLEEAQKLDPDDINYPYELAYAYYVKKDYKKATKYLEGILNHKDINDRVYQLLGNSYDNLGKSDKAIETYKAGLKQFPNSGNLYLEMGVMQMGKKDYYKALDYYEKGIEVEPKFSSNYYWASKIYCSSTEEVWGMIYGEIFMNLERNSRRTAEISKLLYDTYKSEIKFISDTSFSVSFSKNASINISNLTDSSKMKLPFGIGVYEPTLMLSMLSVKTIDINSLDDIRSTFVDNYFTNGHDETYPNVLFSYQKQVKEAGHIEAYNHWILMKGDEDGFGKWHSENKDKWDNFVNWFGENGLKINDKNKFYSGQY
ncbi:MAG: tetratricopeptide repeat protein [Brumimicrobium sp.]|nr:tetratricopeptide repeat protein [Brumimicrobium sp.]